MTRRLSVGTRPRLRPLLAGATIAIATAALSRPEPAHAQDEELDDLPDLPDVAPAPDAPERRERGDHLRVYALTFSPGDEPFYKFGHNAIWIHDEHATRTRDRVYNWGTFSFGDPALIPKFVVGRFMYWLSTMALSATKRVYAHENRWVDAQELDLTGEQKLALQAAVEENLKGDNKYYKYDYFRDNCSTRVRDHLDRVTNGALHEAAKAPGRLTLRGHMNRVTADTPAFQTVLNLALGDLIDKPTTKWDEAYLPGELQNTLKSVVLKDADGKERPLVKNHERLVTAKRADPPFDPPQRLHWFAGIGALLAAITAGLGNAASKGSKPARVGLGVLMALASLALGFLGLFFLFVWFFTDHQAGYGNENIFVCTPFAWALVAGGVGVARGKAEWIERSAKIATAAAGLALLGVVVKVLPWFDQANWWFLAMLAPPWVALAWGLRKLAAVTVAPPAPPPAEKKVRKKKSPKDEAASEDGSEDGAGPGGSPQAA